MDKVPTTAAVSVYQNVDSDVARPPVQKVSRKSTELSQNERPTPPAKAETGIISEHGHFLHPIDPMNKHSGASVVTFFNGLFTTIIGISTLGASVTFSYVLSNNTQPPVSNKPTFDTEQIQLFLAISWLLFLLALAFASLGSTLLTFFKTHFKADWDGRHGRTSQFTVQWYAVVASTLLGGLTIGAFAFLCLVVVAYTPVVGWTALGFTGLFGLIILVGLTNQVPWPWRQKQSSNAT